MPAVLRSVPGIGSIRRASAEARAATILPRGILLDAAAKIRSYLVRPCARLTYLPERGNKKLLHGLTRFVSAGRSLCDTEEPAGVHEVMNHGPTVTTFVGEREEVLVFGPFRLDPVRHVLHKAGEPVRLGSRALEILLALVEQAGQTVATNELLARVWRNCVVERGTLRVHIAALRKILRDSEPVVDYVENVAGRGYRFAAPVTRVPGIAGANVPHAAASRGQASGAPDSSDVM